jgi:hypothetical protein
MSHEHRSKIASAQIINRLQEIALGKVDGSQVSVNARLPWHRKPSKHDLIGWNWVEAEGKGDCEANNQ